MNSQITIAGSQLDNAQKKGISVAKSFLDAEIVIIFDNSGSMMATDAPGGMSRKDYAQKQMTTIQGKNPGKVALICFADRTEYAPSGSIINVGGTTDLAGALKFARVADDCGLKILVISDGEPNNSQAALDVAKTYKTKIDALYCGSEGNWSGGREFLQRLTDATGGDFFTSEQPAMLENQVEMVLLK